MNENSNEINNHTHETNKKYGKCFIGGCVYNCGKYLKNVIKQIHEIGTVFDDYCIIIAYEHSYDDSLEILENCKQKYNEKYNDKSKFHILVNENPRTRIRTQNISNARNSILNEIRKLQDNTWEYFMMIDMDDVSNYDVNKNTLHNILSRDDWDSISFNRSIYYDIWALSIEPFLFSCWNWTNARTVVEKTREYIQNKLKELDENDLLEVKSAFNGCALYRYSKFFNCSYDWTTCTKFITHEQFKKNIEATNEKPIINTNNDDCEHRHFHMEAIHKNGARIRVSPLKLFMC